MHASAGLTTKGFNPIMTTERAEVLKPFGAKQDYMEDQIAHGSESNRKKIQGPKMGKYVC